MTREFLIGRHIEDLNDLHNNRDCGIDPERASDADIIGEQIVSSAEADGASMVLFITSPKIRVIETTTLAREYIHAHSSLRTHMIHERGLREIDQGKYILPDDYEVGMYIPELMKAWEVFWTETFENGDFFYRFGSTTNQYGEVVYPELANFFSEPGEHYTEYCHRLYSTALTLLHNTRLLRRNGTKLVTLTHSAPLAIFRELHGIAENIMDGTEYPVGTLMQACWDAYKVRTNNQDPGFGFVDRIDISPLCNIAVRDRLEEEVKYLSGLMSE